jgi:hypothetical protein
VAPADLLATPAVANAENRGSTCFRLHLGHSGGSWSRLITSFSKMCPQLGQAYSKIGMETELNHSLGLMSQLSCLELPSGEAGRAQLKRDIPGMRGRIPNQTTRKKMKTKTPSISILYAHC